MKSIICKFKLTRKTDLVSDIWLINIINLIIYSATFYSSNNVIFRYNILVYYIHTCEIDLTVCNSFLLIINFQFRKKKNMIIIFICLKIFMKHFN